MKRDAEAHSAEDDERRSLVEAKNKAEAVVYETDKVLKEHGDKVSAEVRADIERKKKAVAEAKTGSDAKAIDRAIEDLLTASQEIAKKIYESAPKGQPEAKAASGAASASEKGKDDDHVIDADFEVK
jgi:molecular chaperone DnaK